MWRILLACVGATGMLVTVMVASAVAQECPGIQGHPMNTMYKPNANSRAVAVWGPGMLVYNHDTDCGHVSALIARNSSYTRYVEVGYYEDPQGKYKCIDTTGTVPRVLAYAEIGDTASCKHSTSAPVVGQYDGFRVQDANQDGLWTFYWNDVDQWQSPDMGTFVTGLLENNG